MHWRTSAGNKSKRTSKATVLKDYGDFVDVIFEDMVTQKKLPKNWIVGETGERAVFQRGERVRVRDRGENYWQLGTVRAPGPPLQITVDSWDTPPDHNWDEVEYLTSRSKPASPLRPKPKAKPEKTLPRLSIL